LTSQIGIKTLWALCAPFTVRWAERMGCRIQKDIGNEGTFYYPKLDLLATVVLLEDCETLIHAKPHERNRVFELREKPNQISLEAPPGRKQEAEVTYELSIPNIRPGEFHDATTAPRTPYTIELKREERLPEF